ncbi:MAG: aminotransferase class I/II-fold pyridoxal phosphate-dependent enzyme [Deltaproteobacteria bacterium]|nr:aminotransferase class I/II-fold pyridoxal phosphate-dependent enzyme [Deltaproteobacteria bacterium]
MDEGIIAKRAIRLAESPTLALLAKVNGLKTRGERIFEFHIGEPDFTIPPNVAEAMKRALDRGKTDYTHQAGLPELREAISHYYKAEMGLHFESADIVVTSGPKDTIFKLMGTLVNEGDKLVVFDPHWESYGEQVQFFGGSNIFVPRDKDDLSYRLDILEDAFKQRPKALFFTDPDNPTGYKASERELKAVAQLARKYNVLILADEIYWLHCYDSKFKSIAHFYPEGTIILSGASKAWAATGLRIGFALFPKTLKHLATQVAKVTGQASSSVNTPAQYAITDAIMNPETRLWEKEMIGEFRKRRDLVKEAIGPLIGYELGGAFYAAPKTPINAEIFSEKLLKEEGVSVLPLTTLSSGDHDLFENRVRLAYVTDRETLKEGLKRFMRFIKRLD